ncbi:MAG: hypothetical protein SGCHY_004947 [Lobulomycetales sp.]
MDDQMQQAALLHSKFTSIYLSRERLALVSEKRQQAKGQTDTDVLRNNNIFIRSSSHDLDLDPETSSWEQRVAIKYYEKLFKEYCLCNLERYKKGQIAMRWRTKKEVVDGKGQFVCASLSCLRDRDLASWEVNFAYVENQVRKNALVKVRLCPECSDKLNYKTRKRKSQTPDRQNERKARRRDDESETTDGVERGKSHLPDNDEGEASREDSLTPDRAGKRESLIPEKEDNHRELQMPDRSGKRESLIPEKEDNHRESQMSDRAGKRESRNPDGREEKGKAREGQKTPDGKRVGEGSKQSGDKKGQKGKNVEEETEEDIEDFLNRNLLF